MKLLTAGEVLAVFCVADGLPLAHATEFRRIVAGAELNVANGFARLGHAAGLVTVVGHDSLGDAVVDRIRAGGIGVHAHRADAPTGVLVRELATIGPVDTLHLRSGSAATQLGADMIDQAWEPDIDVVYVTGITTVLSEPARNAVLRLVGLARQQGALVALDPNLRERLASRSEYARALAPLRGLVDVLIGDPAEIALFAGVSESDGPGAALASGCQVVVTKLGADGARATDGTTEVSVPAAPTRLVDTIGAGDAFTGGFLVSWLESRDLRAALDLGTRVAAAVVATPGDLDGFPRRLGAERGESR